MNSLFVSLVAIACVPLLSAFQWPEGGGAGEGAASAGSIPAGVDYFIVKGPPQSGTATAECAATCIACKQTFGLYFSNGGGSSDDCLTLDINGAGPSDPFEKYSRPGYLIANCTQSFCVTLTMTSCSAPGSGFSFIETHCLTCGCT